MKCPVLVLACIFCSFVSVVELKKPFKVEDCLKGKGIATISRFTVSPDPISLSQNITADVDLTLAQDIPPNAQIRTSVYKVTSVMGYPINIKAPCIGDRGSCTVDHCKFLDRYKAQACPFFPSGVKCDCPLKAGHYGGKKVTVPELKLGTLIKFLASGDFKIVIELFVKEKSEEKKLACFALTGSANP